MLRKFVVGAVVAAALAIPTGTAFGDPPPCEAGDPGCKTEDDPNKNNPKFKVTQRGNVGAPGTADTCTGANPGHTKKVCPD